MIWVQTDVDDSRATRPSARTNNIGGLFWFWYLFLILEAEDRQRQEKQAEFKIKGLTCEGCAEHVNSEVAKVIGVVQYQTSYENANSITKFDNTKTTIDSFAKAINKTSYSDF